MNRIAALVLLVTGQALVAMLAPEVAFAPAFLVFLGAGAIMARTTLDQ